LGIAHKKVLKVVSFLELTDMRIQIRLKHRP